MFKMIENLLQWVDSRAEKRVRQAADVSGRRSMLAKIGGVMVGTALMPVLPFDRSMGLAYAGDNSMTETSCDYWRYCALDGTTCESSGGTLTSCPPGSEASKVSWVGTCRNPKDDKDYLVSYNDCCGKGEVAGGTICYTNKAERPGYRMGVHNDVNWCMANANKGYHCTVAILVGMADE
jgi:methylamine dehydrogenase light chain